MLIGCRIMTLLRNINAFTLIKLFSCVDGWHCFSEDPFRCWQRLGIRGAGIGVYLCGWVEGV